MSGTPELDLVADQRAKLAEHALLPWWFWAASVPVFVVAVGWPLLTGWVSENVATYGLFLPAALLLVIAQFVVRRRAGVRVWLGFTAYPSARWIWLGTLAAGIGGWVAIAALTLHDAQGFALAVLAVVTVVAIAGSVAARRAMRADIRAGRVRP
jgi:hypothetical protein